MKPEKFRTNKSSLKKFLEAKDLPPSNVPHNKKNSKCVRHFTTLMKIAAEAFKERNFEDLARLKSVGCTLNEGNLLATSNNPIETFLRLESLRESDKWANNYNGSWNTYLTFGTRGSMREEEYVVAGKSYPSKEVFLLSQTDLGRALL
jgi:hypothetical protein